MEQEGVIQFACEHQNASLAQERYAEAVNALCAWRRLFRETGLVGAVPERYEGLGFGNVSARVTPYSTTRGKRAFLISGSQTGAKPVLTLAHFAEVQQYSIANNMVRSRGQVLPSSESMTHGAVYDLSPAIRYVFHVHSPCIWKAAKHLGLPSTSPNVAYGTQAMARDVERLYRTTALSETRVFAMAGHVDGVVGFGRSAEEAGLAVIAALARAYKRNS